MSNSSAPTARTRVVREPQRAVYDRDTVYQILDEGFICHVGFAVEGQPCVIPTSYARKNDLLYVHGSAASRMLRHAGSGVPVCVTVTLLDGLVLARSIFNHSMNYRWKDARRPNEQELKATAVLQLPIEEFSAKVRQGPVIDDDEDYNFPTWAGVIPLSMVSHPPLDDSRLLEGITAPGYAKEYSRRK